MRRLAQEVDEWLVCVRELRAELEKAREAINENLFPVFQKEAVTKIDIGHEASLYLHGLVNEKKGSFNYLQS
ncbi:hypothetical protein KJ853_01775 [Patescibacteria group bacterium]|nr:hypothetical protein [Patescibacteria group bacterium]